LKNALILTKTQNRRIKTTKQAIKEKNNYKHQTNIIFYLQI